MKFYTSAEKALKLKVGKFLGLIPTFVEVTGGKLVGGTFLAPSILNRITMVFLKSKKVIESLTTGLRYSEKHRKILTTFCVNIRKKNLLILNTVHTKDKFPVYVTAFFES